MSSTPRNTDFKKPWHKVSSNKEHFEKELAREISSQHVLYGKSANAVAYRQDMDEVLFEIHETPKIYAIVHLTHNVETRPQWPATRLYKNWDEVCIRLLEDHKGWEDDEDDD